MTRWGPRTPDLQHPTISVLAADHEVPYRTVRLTGDLDDTVVPALLDALVTAATGGALRIDATAVRSWETPALRAFTAAHRYFGTQGCTVDIVGVRWNQVVDLLLTIPLDEVPGVAAMVRELQQPAPEPVPARAGGPDQRR